MKQPTTLRERLKSTSGIATIPLVYHADTDHYTLADDPKQATHQLTVYSDWSEAVRHGYTHVAMFPEWRYDVKVSIKIGIDSRDSMDESLEEDALACSDLIIDTDDPEDWVVFPIADPPSILRLWFNVHEYNDLIWYDYPVRLGAIHHGEIRDDHTQDSA